jgi:arylsulfatase A-like enzyme
MRLKSGRVDDFPLRPPGRWLHGMATLVLVGVAACLSAHPRSCQAAPARGNVPNIVLILADDLGFSDLGCYGGEILTPNLDRLAKDGLRFTHFYNCGRGCPTRAALLTGLYPHQAGVGHMMNDYRRPGYRGNLNKECATIAELLEPAGYQSFICGKWHVSRYINSGGPKHNWPLQRGFDSFYGTIHGAGSYFNPVTLCRDNHFVGRPDQGDYYYTDAISDRAAEYLEQAARLPKPFFLYVAYPAPHWPLHAPEHVVRRYRAQYGIGWDELRVARYRQQVALGLVEAKWPLSPLESDVTPWVKTQNRRWQQERMAVYAAQVDLMDRGIGRILEKLRVLGLEQDTLVMFLSDNGASGEEVSSQWQGPHIPEKTHDGRIVVVGNNPNVVPGPASTYQSYGSGWATASNTPFRLFKHYVHEGGIATPFIVRWPAAIPQGNRLVHEVGHVIDVMPTCLEVAKLNYPSIYAGRTIKPAAGQSLLPALQGRKLPDRTLFWEHEGNRAVRDGKWKLVARHRGPWELYDIEADRTELENLAEKFPVIVKDLAATYAEWAERCDVLPWGK